jgi:nucleotide-binding universal stress UspA family protein
MLYQNVLAATDGSDLANAAVNHAAGIARAFNAQLTIVTVALQVPAFVGAGDNLIVSRSVFDELRRVNLDQCAAVLKKAVELAGPDARTETVEYFNAYEGILETAKRIDADLIVMGSHSRGLVSRLIVGSQTSKVVNLSEVPVLIVRSARGTAQNNKTPDTTKTAG